MIEAIVKGLRLAAPTLIVAVVGAVGVTAGQEMGRGLGKWMSERLWKPETTTSRATKKVTRDAKTSKKKKTA